MSTPKTKTCPIGLKPNPKERICQWQVKFICERESVEHLHRSYT